MHAYRVTQPLRARPRSSETATETPDELPFLVFLFSFLASGERGAGWERREEKADEQTRGIQR